MVSRSWRWSRLRVRLGVPGWCSRTMVCLRRRVGHLLRVLLGMGGPGGCRYRHTSGTDERMVGGGVEYPLTHISRITQNGAGWHWTGHASCTTVLRQIEGDRGRGGLIVIGGRKVFLFLYGHELALHLALCASLARLASRIGRGALLGAVGEDSRKIFGIIDGREAHFHLAAAALGTGHESPATAAPG